VLVVAQHELGRNYGPAAGFCVLSLLLAISAVLNEVLFRSFFR
jgi:hypothetical protein